jgi:Ca-activated chloride channel family protein
MAPRQGFAMGRTMMETVVSHREVASVEFLLDGESKVVRDAPPFSASLDLGPLPQPRRVTVVARDSSGVELGRDYLVVNEGSGVFGVRIAKPRPGVEGEPEQRYAGPIDVHAEVEPRRGQGIDRVEFYWKDTLAATRYAPPFRQRIVVPPEAPQGFIRVVAYLEDGNSSEDVVFLNSPGSSEKLQVNLMELYVVVTDRKGRPVRELPQEKFRVLEDGVAQEIGTFSDAGDLPLTVGLAIDSSASMFVKLPEVQFAAAEFLRGLATRRDRAFVVGFGTEPRLTRNTTSDLPEVISSLDVLQPDGQTGIWKAVVYSLVQLQGVPGKKALIVYTDGADEDPDFAYRTALRFARKVGVPIYVILSNNEINRTKGKGLSVRGFLERLDTLTTSVGGKVFFARVGEDLQNVYAEIDEELRSQYLVGYYSEYTGGEEWRQIEVGVEGGGLNARTIAGYYR